MKNRLIRIRGIKKKYGMQSFKKDMKIQYTVLITFGVTISKAHSLQRPDKMSSLNSLDLKFYTVFCMTHTPLLNGNITMRKK